MKKVLIALIAAALVVVSVFGALAVKNSVSATSNLKINEKSSLAEIIELYRSSVKNSKNYKNFGLEVTTSVKLEEINSSSTILNELLSSIMGYRTGDVRMETQSFTFENGRDMNIPDATPLSIIQPSGSYIEDFNASSLALKTISCEDDYALVSFEIKKESADLDSVAAAINPIVKGQENTDKTAITALAPNHSKFVDIGDIISTVVDMLGIDDMINSSDKNNNENDSSSSNQSVGITEGLCTIGNTEFSVYADSNALLHSVTITAPVELKAGFKLMSNVIEASIRITVVQTYMFNY